MKRVAFHTLGCKVNQYETDAMAGLFKKEGYEVVGFEEKADVYVINTCTVTNLGDRKSRQMIRRAKKAGTDSIIVVTGCYSQVSPEEAAGIPGVNLVIGTRDRNKIIDYIKELNTPEDKKLYVENIMKNNEYEDLSIENSESRTRAFIKIQDGCTQFCSYCIIPYARGPVRSRRPGDVLEEARKLASKGFKEIVLTGIHIASYGKDIGDITLVDIIGMVHRLEGIERIRLGSLEPAAVTPGFLTMAADFNKLCPHFHISLQSGCDRTLRNMNRKYTASEYRNTIEYLRKTVKNAAVATDIMVGFPGETDEDFEESFRFVEELSFAQTHIFKYSPRKGTPAASFPDQVPSGIKESRSERFLKLSRVKSLEYNSKYLGKVMPVLFEQEVKDMEGHIEGLTENYIRVSCRAPEEIIGEIAEVRLQRVYGDIMLGELD